MTLPPHRKVAGLDQQAAAAGIQLSYEAADGSLCHASEIAKRELLESLGFDATAPGRSAQECAELPAASSPSPDGELGGPCFMPDWLQAGRCFGVTCQIYGLRSARQYGIGDFADLLQLGELVAKEGADFVGVSPLHALFAADPGRYSPYSPSSRRFLNPLYIALDWVDEGETAEAVGDDLSQDGSLVDYEGVARRKMERLRSRFLQFRKRHAGSGSPADIAFTRYLDDGGTALRDFSRFETLSELAVAKGGPGAAGWFGWPPELKDKNSAAVEALCGHHEEEVHFHAWLQWTASEQLERVQEDLLRAGMRIGLYLDVAVGVAPDGAETWSEPDATIAAARIGAPPDPFNRNGQNWGLAPLAPSALARPGSRLFRDVIEQCMRSAGAIRLDHVMALERLFLIPEGRSPEDGAYVSYPLAALIAEIADVSRSTSTVVIGEDLGTVRPAFRDVLAEMEVQSYRVLAFERTPAGDFKAPSEWPHAALACAATHDLATLHGWWVGADLTEGASIGLFDDAELARLEEAREQDRGRLLTALEGEGLAPAKGDHITGVASEALAVAVHAFLARTPSRLLAIQLEDLLAMREQANVPGTIHEHPNWRRRIPKDLETVAGAHLWSRLFNAVRNERPRTL
jgi:4-alpha-glucanotransferase